MALAMNKRYEKLNSVREIYNTKEEIKDDRTSEEIINDTLNAFKQHYEEKRG